MSTINTDLQSAESAKSADKLPVWRGTWALIRFRPWYFIATMAFGVIFTVSQLIPGLITRVLVEVGDQVEAGQPLLVLEAMKMENEIRSPRAGTIKSIPVAVGDRVNSGDVLVEFDEGA